jgi:RND family efflux transporter MFP subunit
MSKWHKLQLVQAEWHKLQLVQVHRAVVSEWHNLELVQVRRATQLGSAKATVIIGILVLTLVGLLGAGYFPRTARARQVAAFAEQTRREAVDVSVISVQPAPADTELTLPGNIQAVTEAPIYARTDGYVRQRLVDIGDRVTKGQLLAEIESPEVDQQLRQAKATVQQAQSALGQAKAALQQASANERLAQVTLNRIDALVAKGVLSKQDGDEKQAAFLARKADVAAAEANVNAAANAISGAEANVQRLTEIQSFQKVRAPYDGLITARNVVLGTLVSAGSNNSIRELYRITQLSPLKINVNVPQSEVSSIHTGQECDFQVQEFAGRKFTAKVIRTANALDAASRSLLVELHFSNPAGQLLPGMYAQVSFKLHRTNPPLLVPGDSILTGKAGPQVAVVRGDVIRYASVNIGRDYGAQTEILSGIDAGDVVVLNPTEELRDGTRVHAVQEKTTPPAGVVH